MLEEHKQVSFRPDTSLHLSCKSICISPCRQLQVYSTNYVTAIYPVLDICLLFRLSTSQMTHPPNPTDVMLPRTLHILSPDFPPENNNSHTSHPYGTTKPGPNTHPVLSIITDHSPDPPTNITSPLICSF